MKGSTLWFRLFLWLAGSTVVVILLHSFDLIVLSDTGGSVEWIKWAVYLIGLTTTLFMTLTKLHTVLKVLLSAASAFAIIAIGKTVRYFAFNVPVIILIDNVTLIFMTSIIVMLLIFINLLFYNKFVFMHRLLDYESELSTKESYVTWLKEENVEDTEKKLTAYLKTALNIGIILLILTLAGLIIEPEGKLHYTIAFMLFFLSGVGMYMILYQFKTLLEAKMGGEEIPADEIPRWNRMIAMFFIPVIVAALAVPWYYRVFDITEVSSYVNDKMSGVEITINTQPEPDRPDVGVPETTSEVDIEAKPEKPDLSETEPVVPVSDDGARYPLAIRIAFFGLIGLAALYFVLGIIGAALYKKLRYAKQTWAVRFLIKRYQSLKGLIDGLANFFKIIGRFFGAMFGLHKFKRDAGDKELSNPVAQHLFSLFKVSDEMTDEKKDEIRTIVKDFVRMIDMTSRYITPYRFYYGPQEYIKRVAKQLPELKEVLNKVVTIFNESRYSLHILSDVRIGNFQGGVNYIVDRVSDPNIGKSQSE